MVFLLQRRQRSAQPGAAQADAEAGQKGTRAPATSVQVDASANASAQVTHTTIPEITISNGGGQQQQQQQHVLIPILSSQRHRQTSFFDGGARRHRGRPWMSTDIAAEKIATIRR